jgi:hypothetical protein
VPEQKNFYKGFSVQYYAGHKKSKEGHTDDGYKYLSRSSPEQTVMKRQQNINEASIRTVNGGEHVTFFRVDEYPFSQVPFPQLILKCLPIIRQSRNTDLPSRIVFPYVFERAIEGEPLSMFLQQDLITEKSMIDLVVENQNRTGKAHGKEKHPCHEPAPVVDIKNLFCSFFQGPTGPPSDQV